MKCHCGQDLEGQPFVAYETTDRLEGEWNGGTFEVSESKDTGDSEVMYIYLMCSNGHTKEIAPTRIEW